MNRSRFLLATLLSAVLAISACSKQETAAPAEKARRSPSVEIVSAEAKGFNAGSMMSTIVVYVFFDPQCPHCARLWASSIPLQKKARFIWIPVGLMNATSSAQGATLLSAADPAQSMAEHETSLTAGKGGIGASPGVTDEAKASVKANTALFNNLGLESVPFTIVRNARTGQTVSRGGSMETAALAELIGVDAP